MSYKISFFSNNWTLVISFTYLLKIWHLIYVKLGLGINTFDNEQVVWASFKIFPDFFEDLSPVNKSDLLEKQKWRLTFYDVNLFCPTRVETCQTSSAHISRTQFSKLLFPSPWLHNFMHTSHAAL